MTLIELLTAFSIFTLMLAGMVALTVGTLNGWRAGERRKQTYERAQRILERIQTDLRCAYVDEDWVGDAATGARTRPAQMRCALDETGRQELALTRAVTAGPPDPAPARRGSRGSTTTEQTVVLSEVLYRLDPRKPTLWRAERPFDRADVRRQRSLLGPAGRDPQGAAPLDEGVLHLEFRFWSTHTRQWETSRRPGDGGPSLLWDSSRELDGFFLKLTARDVDQSLQPRAVPHPPEFVLPRIVRVMLVLASGDEGAGTRLAQDLQPADRQLVVEDSRAVPDAPGYLRVEDEWIAYDRKEGRTIGISARGADRAHKSGGGAHPAGAPVQGGELFVTDVVIPAARDPRP
jgi:hypothetical protein